MYGIQRSGIQRDLIVINYTQKGLTFTIDLVSIGRYIDDTGPNGR